MIKINWINDLILIHDNNFLIDCRHLHSSLSTIIGDMTGKQFCLFYFLYLFLSPLSRSGKICVSLFRGKRCHIKFSVIFFNPRVLVQTKLVECRKKLR